MKIKEQIERTLQVLNPLSLKVIDESHQHAGKKEETHFRIEIESDSFKDLSLLKRHRLVYDHLNPLMPKVHAISIHPFTSDEDASPPPSPSCAKA